MRYWNTWAPRWVPKDDATKPAGGNEEDAAAKEGGFDIMEYEATARALNKRVRIGALSGDLATERDAERLCAAGIPAESITTGSACHLDARLVHRALHELPVESFDLLFVENVGNLVCPAIYDLGQTANVVVLSVTEGEDKPLKYPVMFRKADLVVITKIDLLPHLPDLRPEALHENLAQVMPEPRAIEVSATTGEGLVAWIAWLEKLSEGTARGPEAAKRCGTGSARVRPPPLPAWPSGDAEGE